MKKALLVSSAVIFTAALGAPGLVGLLAKERIEQSFKALSNPNFTLTMESYEQGWFNAKGTVNARVNLPVEANETPIQFNMKYQVNLKHGPVFWHDGLQFGWASWEGKMTNINELATAVELSVRDQDQPEVNQKGVIDLLGQISVTDHISAFQLQGCDTVMTIGDFQGTGHLAGENFSYQGRLDELAFLFDAVQGHILVQGIDVATDGWLPKEHKDGDPLPGSFNIGISTLTIDNNVLANNLDIHTQVVLNDQQDAANITVRYSAERMATPQILITNALFEASLNNYSMAFNRAYTQALGRCSSLSECSYQSHQIQKAMDSSFADLMAQKPELHISKANFTLPEGSFNSRIDIRLDSYDVTLNQLQNSVFLRNNLAVKAHASMDKQLAKKMAYLFFTRTTNKMVDPEQIDTMLSMLLVGGMVTLKDGKYSTDIVMKHGSTTINGRAIPLPHS